MNRSRTSPHAVRIKTARFKMTARPLTIWHLTLQNNNSAWSIYDAKVIVTR